MTIEEIKEAKSKAEREIFYTIKWLEKTINISVDSIGLTTVEKPEGSELVNVKLHLVL